MIALNERQQALLSIAWLRDAWIQSECRLVEDALESNMESFRNILVDIDATAIAHPALERAILLAKRSGAKLTVADVVTIPPDAHRYLRRD